MMRTELTFDVHGLTVREVHDRIKVILADVIDDNPDTWDIHIEMHADTADRLDHTEPRIIGLVAHVTAERETP